MRNLIVGIAGFVGKHLARHLRAQGEEVLGTSRPDVAARSLQEPFARHPAPPSPRAASESSDADSESIPWNIAEPIDADALERIRSFRPDVVFHLAAISIPADCGRSTPTPDALRANVEGTAHVVQLVRSLPGPPRLIFASTSQVYDATCARSGSVDESAPLRPDSGYAWTKYYAEQQILNAVADSRFEAIIVRAFKHSGPGQSSRMMLSEWARQFAENVSPVRVQSLESYVDLTDVRDVVRAYHALAEIDRPAAIYNLGSGLRRRTGDILTALQLLADPQRAICVTGAAPRDEPIANTERLRGDTGWEPQIPLGQTLADTLAFWLA
ncbi:MAG: NAD(P)-dependent oxidoreductase [Planctomycetes bacterium]|nr:NAD(P)-dependent oxidoreductase [Planctomycetota bacterium]